MIYAVGHSTHFSQALACLNFRMKAYDKTLMKSVCLGHDKMGLDARKPVLGGLRTAKAQTSLRVRAD